MLYHHLVALLRVWVSQVYAMLRLATRQVCVVDRIKLSLKGLDVKALKLQCFFEFLVLFSRLLPFNFKLFEVSLLTLHWSFVELKSRADAYLFLMVLVHLLKLLLPHAGLGLSLFFADGLVLVRIRCKDQVLFKVGLNGLVLA